LDRLPGFLALPAVWTRGKLRIRKRTYTSQSPNHEEATAKSLTVTRIKVAEGRRKVRVPADLR
jgi:hypothetical protein